jgi:hypothetical protein
VCGQEGAETDENLEDEKVEGCRANGEGMGKRIRVNLKIMSAYHCDLAAKRDDFA